MSENPKITVITVVYNAKSTIEETMLSVLNQTYSNIEYIVVDGASTDGTLDIIKDYETRTKNREFPNISFRYISEPDKGIYDAMNKGIDIASGEWINFMNAGDSFFENNVIDQIVELYDGKSDIVYGDSCRHFETGKYIDRATLSKLDYMRNCHQAFFVKTQLLKHNKFDTSYQICADAKIFYDAYKEGLKFQHISVVVCNYENSEGVSMKQEKKYFVEMARIDGSNKTLKWKLKYALFLLKMQIKKIISRRIIRETA